MKIAIIECYAIKKISKSIIDAHYRNSLAIADFLKCDLIVTESDFKKAFKKSYDVLILGYPSGYAPFKSIRKLSELNPDAQKIVLSNEYNIDPTVGGFSPYYLIANYDQQIHKTRLIKGFFHLNLNLLLSRKSNEQISKKYDCVYYGTFRVNRSKYFKKYLQNDIFLSTSRKNLKKFDNIGCNCRFIDKLSWGKGAETLNLFRYSLYIEDEYTHTVFNNLANRFYESAFCNCVIFFDINCKATIEKSEIGKHIKDIEFFLVSSKKELDDKIKICNKDFEKYLSIQKRWTRGIEKSKKEMLKNLKRIIEEVHAKNQQHGKADQQETLEKAG